MKTSGIFKTGKAILPYDGNAIQLVPIGDIHFGCANHATGSFKRWCDWASKLSNPYFFGMGDYFDALSSSERASLRRADLHDQTYIMLNETAVRREKELIKKLDFINFFLSLYSSNHQFNL